MSEIANEAPEPEFADSQRAADTADRDSRIADAFQYVTDRSTELNQRLT